MLRWRFLRLSEAIIAGTRSITHAIEGQLSAIDPRLRTEVA